MDVNLKNDLSTLTQINETLLTKLSDKLVWCISDSVEKAMIKRDDIVNIDTGIGVLTINIDNKNIRYRFTPSDALERSISATVINERNDLTSALEDSLVSKLTTMYKDFF